MTKKSCPHPTLRENCNGHCVLCDGPVQPPAATKKSKPSAAQLLAEIPPEMWRAEHARRSFADFFRAGWSVLEPTTPLAWSWPYEAVCAHLQATIEDWARRQHDPTFVQRIRDLLVTLPPGFLKSRLLTYLIPWAWLRWPELRAICLSCNPRVALRDSMYARDVIASQWYQQTFRPTWTVRIFVHLF